MLIISNIYKSFGEQKVLDGVSFEIEKGTICTLVGNNGSGKTTLINIITGFIKSDSGSVQLNKVPLDNKTSLEINRIGISRTFQDLRLIKNITVKENILLALKRKNNYTILNEFKKFRKNEFRKVDEILEKISLTNKQNSAAAQLSYGQQKLLTIGCCLATDSQILLIDEPVAGIDDVNSQKIKSLIEHLAQDVGKSILQIEHNLEYIKETSNKILYLKDGKVFVFDNYPSFINDSNIRTNYLENVKT